MKDTSHTAPTDDLYTSFRNPDPAYSPCPLWWWSGDTLDLDRLKWQMERYREGGVWNLVVINLAPSGPLYGHFADDPPFASEEWWELFRGVLEHARTLGMRIWFYDQIGFSGANIQGQVIARHPDFAGHTIERVTNEATGTVSVACPTDGSPLAASVCELDANGVATGLPHPLPIVDRAATWRGDGAARVSLVYTARRGFDYLNPDACATLLDTIHGEFERRLAAYMPDVLVGSFQDELPTMPLWSADFAAEFQRRHGYELLPRLDALWDDQGDESLRVRRDYHATRAALAERAFFKPLFDWHDERGLIVGVDQQNPARAGDPIGGVRIYADYMKTHRWFSAPGSDHHGEAKIHSSLAHLYGRERVWIESFHSSGWGGTLEETFDWLLPWLRAGANLYNPHATYYGTRGGWFEWAPPSTDWRQPYWAHYRVFADAVSRLCKLLTRGVHLCDAGVLFPTATVQGGVGEETSADAEQAHTAYLDLVGSMVWFNQSTGILDQLGIDFDVLDDDSIARATTDGDRLRIGDETYRTVVLPACTVLKPDTAAALVDFADRGGEILALDRLPERLTADDPDQLVARLNTMITPVDETGLRDRLAASPPLVTAPVPTLVRQVDGQTVIFVPAAFPGASKINGWPVAKIDYDRARYAREMTVTVRGVRGTPQLWNPFDGSRTAIAPERYREVDDGVEVRVPLNGAPCAILVFGSGGEPDPVSGERESVIAEMDPTWDVALEPTLDNQWGDFTSPPSFGPFPLQHWTFAGDDGNPVLATWGSRGSWTGPGTPDEIAAANDDATWQTASWSLSRGIAKDPLHPRHLGPAGHVPEEVIEFGMLQPGRAVRLRTRFTIDEPDGFTGWLIVGAAAEKRLQLDSEDVAIDPAENARYQTAVPLSLDTGEHALDLTLVAHHEVRLRAWFALTTDLARSRRPDRLSVLDGPHPETTIRFETTVAIPEPVRSGDILVSTRGPARVLVDGEEVGRQGGYLPYGDGSSSHPYDITDLLTSGTRTIAVEVEDTGAPPIAAVDGAITFASGRDDLWLMTDPSWAATREGAPIPLAIEPRPAGDPQLMHLRQRPHPLPGAAWLEGPDADPGVIHPTAWYPPDATTPVRWRGLVPPGATRATIPVIGNATATLDGVPLGETEARGTGPWTVNLPNPEAERRHLEIEVQPEPGFQGGAALSGPVTYDVGPGRMATGNWAELGLRDYSGIVRYRQVGSLPDLPTEGRIMLDLGDVRGSVEVLVNGQSAGVRIAGPFRFDVTDLVRGARGQVTIEIVVANTLGPYLDATSPTPFVLPGQTVSGLLGPVRLLHLI